MVKINFKPDCGNSPKMEFLKEFNIVIYAKKNVPLKSLRYENLKKNR